MDKDGNTLQLERGGPTFSFFALQLRIHLIYSTVSQRSTAKTLTSHPVVSASKICISSKRLQSEVRKKALLKIE